jgi:hypothetical protein
MASTYTLISSNLLASSAASVTFTSIPATYTDLVVRVSARGTTSATSVTTVYRLNGDTTSNYSYRRLSGDGSAASSVGDSNNIFQYIAAGIPAATATANTFGSLEVYIPSYTVSANKPMSVFSVQENNITAAQINAIAHLWRNTAAITSIEFALNTGDFASGTSFYLYGIKNS